LKRYIITIIQNISIEADHHLAFEEED